MNILYFHDLEGFIRREILEMKYIHFEAMIIIDLNLYFLYNNRFEIGIKNIYIYI